MGSQGRCGSACKLKRLKDLTASGSVLRVKEENYIEVSVCVEKDGSGACDVKERKSRPQRSNHA